MPVLRSSYATEGEKLWLDRWFGLGVLNFIGSFLIWTLKFHVNPFKLFKLLYSQRL